MKRLAIVAISILALTGCAHHYVSEATADPYGFFSGIWHGIVAPFAILANIASWAASLIGISILDDIQIVGKPNTGFFYYLGFLIGLSAYGGTAAGK